MTIHLPPDVECDILAKVHSGHFASVDEAITRAWRAFHRQEPTEQFSAEPTGTGSGGAVRDDAEHFGVATAHTLQDRHAEATNLELQQRLLEAGVISEIKPPITDMTPYEHRQAVPVQGEPLSETVIRERR